MGGQFGYAAGWTCVCYLKGKAFSTFGFTRSHES